MPRIAWTRVLRSWRSRSADFCSDLESGRRAGTCLRLNKFISETGACSRREADKRIEAGRVTCNGQVAVLGTQVADGDEVRIDGELIGAKKKQIYIALNKPVGIVCTTEAHIEDNIVDL